jgi:UDP-N-acetyl-D-mannosaminuronate dehydrogenase
MASLVKLTENSYRHILISIAEELKMIFGDRFEELRKLCNTKWNIDIMEAREGISGLCLPKDIRILHEYTKSDLLEMVMLIDEKYRKELEDGGKVLVSQISNNR